MSNTQDNLQTDFAGESQANGEYLFFTERVEMVERYLQVCMEAMRNG